MDAITNYPDHYTRYRAYNGWVSQPVFSAESATEPVTLAEAKVHMIISHTDDDTYITALIKQCRSAIERYTGVGLISRTVTAYLNNGKGNIELPYGPVTTFTSMGQKNGDAIVSDNYKIYGTPWTYIESPAQDYIKVVYIAGYTNATIPDDLKLALLCEIAYRYRFRGTEKREQKSMVLCDESIGFAINHKRGSWLV